MYVLAKINCGHLHVLARKLCTKFHYSKKILGHCHNFQESNEHKFLNLSVSPFCMMLQKETINPGSVSKGGNLTGQVWKTTIKCYYIINIFPQLLTLFRFFQIEIFRFKLKTYYYLIFVTIILIYLLIMSSD